MPARRVYAHEKVTEDQGKVALMRGPIVYCIESVDQPQIDLSTVSLPLTNPLTAEHRPTLLGGVTVLTTNGLTSDSTPFPLTAIPSYAWANRDPSAMNVWINQNPSPNLPK